MHNPSLPSAPIRITVADARGALTCNYIRPCLVDDDDDTYHYVLARAFDAVHESSLRAPLGAPSDVAADALLDAWEAWDRFADEDAPRLGAVHADL